jgi:peroxisomal coenzyme A diphosphatase NUDT7
LSKDPIESARLPEKTLFKLTADHITMRLDRATLENIINDTNGPPPPSSPHQPTCVSLLFFGEETPRFLAILKADRPGYPWRNQVALPGGHIDEGDTSPQEAALRELTEEVSVAPENVTYLGSLGHFQTLQNKDIEVFTGTWDKPEDGADLNFDTNEIARVLEVPLDAIIHTHLKNGYHGYLPPVHELVYPVEDLVIWGVTAKILHHFMERLYPWLD